MGPGSRQPRTLLLSGGNLGLTSPEASVTENVSSTTIVATSGNHMIFIGSTGDVVTGTGGKETIEAYKGGKTITTGANNDTIKFGGSNNVINAGAGTSTLVDAAATTPSCFRGQAPTASLATRSRTATSSICGQCWRPLAGRVTSP